METNNYLDNIFKGIDDSIFLDGEQKNIILDNSRNIIVVAGAGSGKTTVIAAKVKYLVDVMKVKPESILIISFTNKAIDELKKRINDDFNVNAKIETFHKFALSILRKYDSNYKVLGDNSKIIKSIIKCNRESNLMQKKLSKMKWYRYKNKNYNNDIDHLIDYTIETISLLKINNNYPISSKKIVSEYIDFLRKIMDEYNKYNNDNKFVDFEDIIIKATKIVDEVEIGYKYIIIDEYQDISQNRYNLIKKLIYLYDIKTMVVGDDWQAIYSFSGSKLSLFTSFAKENDAKMFLINRTYRNNQELINISGDFVMKNDKQIKKSLISSKTKNFPICIYGYNDINIKFIYIVDKIIKEYGVGKNILVLGRYKNDIKKISSSKFKMNEERITYLSNPEVEIVFMTVHSAKGLGFDNVILINSLNDDYGFPTKIRDDMIRRKINGRNSDIYEERRLFYVALTRTKNCVYILSKVNCESVFIKEIVKYNHVYCDYKIRNNKISFKS